MTETGLSLGTPHYMSPEQATAEKDLTNRSDIYSLGSVLYEMLTGDPPHTGSSAQQIIMKIVTEEAPPVAKVRRAVPPNIAAATAKALEKLPADRFGSAAALADALGDPSFTGAPSSRRDTPPARAAMWNPLSRGLAVTSTAILGIAIWALARPVSQAAPHTYDVGLPDSAPMLPDLLTNLAVSPAGDFVVYVAHRDTLKGLWYRSLVTQETRPLPGTAHAWMPAISPAGDRVAFVTGDGFAKVTPIDGGTVVTLQELNNPTGVQWTSATSLLLSDGDGTRLHWVGADGDDARSQDVAYCILPQLLPDPERVLCGGGGDQFASVIDVRNDTRSDVHLPQSEGPDRASVLRGAQFRLIDGRYLIYMSVGGELRATSFDPQTYAIGRSVTLIQGVRREAYTGAGQYDVAANGTIVYAEGANASVVRLVKFGAGGTIPLAVEPAYFLRYDLSRDGRRLAAVVEGVRDQELRVYDLVSGRSRVWLRHPWVGEPVWTPDGDQLLVTIGQYGYLAWATVKGSPEGAQLDTLFRGAVGQQFGPEFTAYRADSQVIGYLWGQPVSTIAANLTTHPPTLDTIAVNSVFGSLSPDGHWLAHQPGGLQQVFVSPSSRTDQRFLVASSEGAFGEPRWLSATELVYWECCASWYRVEVSGSGGNPAGQPTVWHTDPRSADTPGQSYKLTWDRGLVYVRTPEREPVTYLRVIPNWVEQMKRAVDEANR
jgi:serine/threonine-protein kinase